MKATYKFRIQRQGKRKIIEEARPLLEPSGKLPVHPVARRLALAYYIERCIEVGVIADYAAAARRLGISRARMTQVMDLMLLPVQTQDAILLGQLHPSRKLVRSAGHPRDIS